MKCEVTMQFTTDEPLTQRAGERLWGLVRRFGRLPGNYYEVEVYFPEAESLPDAIAMTGNIVRASVGDDFIVTVDEVKAARVH